MDAEVNSASIFHLLFLDDFHTCNSHNENTATLEKCTWEETTSNLLTSVVIFHFFFSFHGYPLFTLLKYRQKCKFSQYLVSFCYFIVVHLATTSLRQSLTGVSGNRLILNWCKLVTLRSFMLKDDVLSFIYLFIYFLYVILFYFAHVCFLLLIMASGDILGIAIYWASPSSSFSDPCLLLIMIYYCNRYCCYCHKYSISQQNSFWQPYQEDWDSSVLHSKKQIQAGDVSHWSQYAVKGPLTTSFHPRPTN